MAVGGSSVAGERVGGIWVGDTRVGRVVDEAVADGRLVGITGVVIAWKVSATIVPTISVGETGCEGVSRAQPIATIVSNIGIKYPARLPIIFMGFYPVSVITILPVN